MAMASHKGWSIYQLGIKTAFFNGPLDEAFVKQNPWYEITGQEDKVYILRNALYGLK